MTAPGSKLDSTFAIAYKISAEILYRQAASSKQKQIVVKEESVIIYHKVKKGENLTEIAKKYKIVISDLKKWNKLKSPKATVGQSLVIHKTVEVKKSIVTNVAPSRSKETGNKEADKSNSQPQNSNTTNLNQSDSKAVEYYTVQKGDTLWSIASRYEGVTVSDLKTMNNISNESELKPGTKLKVAVTGK